MFRQFVVKNYRGFSSLHFKGLERINLIAGVNNSGKTALLEAIHLHNNPSDLQLPITINRARGIAEAGKAVEEIVAWHFLGRDSNAGLEISSYDQNGTNRTLSMWLIDAATSRIQFKDAEKALSESFRSDISHSNLPRLVMRHESDGTVRESIGVFGGGGTYSLNAKVPDTIPSVFLGSGPPNSEREIRQFGELESAKRQDEILPALRILEPRLKRLSLVPLSLEPVIHGDIGLRRLVPLPFMGEGVRRVLSIVMAIASAAGGVVLIDEIENGLHYSVQQKVWQAIALAARQSNVQIFATTHSWECLVKAHEAFAEDDIDDFRWHRLQRVNDRIDAVAHDREMIEAALYSGVEIR